MCMIGFFCSAKNEEKRKKEEEKKRVEDEKKRAEEEKVEQYFY